MSSRHRPVRLLLAAALLAGLATAGAGTGVAQTPPATPADAGAAAQGQVVPPGLHPERNHMGSTLTQFPEPVAATAAAGEVSASASLGQPLGLDVSGYQPSINWGQVAADGAKFAYAKATEGTYYTNPSFSSQYNGSYGAGLIRGAYHFAIPSPSSSGAAQANYFVDNGGGWSPDGRTLPPLLDIENNPYGATCYGFSQQGLRSWISDFSNTVRQRTGRFPMIYTGYYFWNDCVGGGGTFAQDNPLFIASYYSSPYGREPLVPAPWTYQTMWQWASSGTFPGDQDIFNGSYDQLVALARGSSTGPVVTPPPPPPAPAPDLFALLLNLIIEFFRSLGFPV